MKKLFISDNERIEFAWAQLEPMLNHSRNTENSKSSIILKTALTCIMLLVIGLSIHHIRSTSSNIKIYTTKYGEKLQILLPDNSIVTLNSNSTLKFTNNWNNKSDREVSLIGEAFFSVKHKKNDQKFLVKLADSSIIEVLGTEFNVNQRNDQSKVVLNSGKIILHMKGLSEEEKPFNVEMKPGELIEYKSKKKAFVIKEVNAEIYSSWKSSIMVFDNTKLGEVLNTIQSNYGLLIDVKDQEIKEMTLSGSAPSDNIEELIEALAETFNINIKKKGEVIIVTK